METMKEEIERILMPTGIEYILITDHTLLIM
jgi:hypothetical protein